MFCENCGTQLPDNSVFCSECGSKISLEENQRQRGPVPPVMRQTAQQKPSEPYAKEAASRRTPRQPSEPYRRDSTPRQPSKPYRRDSTPRQPSEPYRSEGAPRQSSESYVGGAPDIIGLGQYILMIFLTGIPIVNIILLVKWGFFNKQKPNKSNFAKALLFYYLIAVIIYVLYIRLWLSVTSGI